MRPIVAMKAIAVDSSRGISGGGTLAGTGPRLSTEPDRAESQTSQQARRREPDFRKHVAQFSAGRTRLATIEWIGIGVAGEASLASARGVLRRRHPSASRGRDSVGSQLADELHLREGRGASSGNSSVTTTPRAPDHLTPPRSRQARDVRAAQEGVLHSSSTTLNQIAAPPPGRARARPPRSSAHQTRSPPPLTVQSGTKARADSVVRPWRASGGPVVA